MLVVGRFRNRSKVDMTPPILFLWGRRSSRARCDDRRWRFGSTTSER